jgi:cell division protein FtsW (lipid II flippase)
MAENTQVYSPKHYYSSKMFTILIFVNLGILASVHAPLQVTQQKIGNNLLLHFGVVVTFFFRGTCLRVFTYFCIIICIGVAITYLTYLCMSSVYLPRRGDHLFLHEYRMYLSLASITSP